MNEKTPFIRIAKREDLPKSRIWMIRTIAFAVAILLGALIFLIAGTNPFTAYGTILASILLACYFVQLRIAKVKHSSA